MAFSPTADALIQAARDLASESGSASFTVAQVAERAGSSLKAFYRCFRGKDELLLAMIEDDCVQGTALIEANLVSYPDPLRGFVLELFTLLTTAGYEGYASLLTREHRRLGELHPEELDVALAPLTSLLASLLTTADPKRDAQTMFVVLMGGINDVVLGRVDDPGELAEYLYEFCTHGLTGR